MKLLGISYLKGSGILNIFAIMTWIFHKLIIHVNRNRAESALLGLFMPIEMIRIARKIHFEIKKSGE